MRAFQLPTLSTVSLRVTTIQPVGARLGDFRRAARSSAWRRSAWAAATFHVVTSSAMPSAAAAPPLTVRLEYEIPPAVAGCADEAEFRRRVTSRLGYDPFGADGVMRVRVGATQSASGTEGRLEWRDASGRVRGEQLFAKKNRGCPQLIAEMSFAVAVQIELLRTAESSTQREAEGAPAGPASQETAAPGSSQSSAPPPAPAPEDRQVQPDRARQDRPKLPAVDAPSGRAPWSVTVGGGPAIDIDLATAPTASARLFVGFRYDHVSIELGAGASLPTTDTRPDGSGFHEYTLASDLGLCGHADRFGLCALGVLGLVSARGFGVDEPAAPSGVLARAGLRATISQPLSARLSASLRAEALVLLTPWTVYLNQTPVWTMPTFGSVIGADVTARFP